jgi:hypothetical protein
MSLKRSTRLPNGLSFDYATILMARESVTPIDAGGKLVSLKIGS